MSEFRRARFQSIGYAEAEERRQRERARKAAKAPRKLAREPAPIPAPLLSDLRHRARWCRENKSTWGPIGFKLADLALRHGVSIKQVQLAWRRVKRGVS